MYIFLALVQSSVDGEDPDEEKKEEGEKREQDEEEEDSSSGVPVPPHQLTHGDCTLRLPSSTHIVTALSSSVITGVKGGRPESNLGLGVRASEEKKRHSVNERMNQSVTKVFLEQPRLHQVC